MQHRTTKQEKEEMVNKYLLGESAKEISLQYGITGSSVGSMLKRRNIKTRSQKEIQRKYKVDDNFFDVVDSEEKAYILGFLYADGYNNTDLNYIEITLNNKDINILRIFKDILKCDRPLQKIKVKLNNKEYNHIRLNITSERLSQRLFELGCVKNKTFKIEFPIWLDESLYNHFIRGVFDGDGSISFLIRDNSPEFNITGTEELLVDVQNILIKECNLNKTKLTKKKNSKTNIVALRYSGTVNLIKIRRWLYKDATIYLERKYNKFMEVEIKKGKQYEYFNKRLNEEF